MADRGEHVTPQQRDFICHVVQFDISGGMGSCRGDTGAMPPKPVSPEAMMNTSGHYLPVKKALEPVRDEQPVVDTSKWFNDPLVDIRSRVGLPPCGECHLQTGETCDICGAQQASTVSVMERHR